MGNRESCALKLLEKGLDKANERISGLNQVKIGTQMESKHISNDSKSNTKVDDKSTDEAR